MAYLKTGRKVSITRQARRALLNAVTRAQAKEDPTEQVITLLKGIMTAISWLDRTHKLLRRETV